MLQDLRAFFAQRDVLEVETPVLSRAAITDPHLHSLRSRVADTVLYLHTSPEFFMKRMLSAWHRDIFQLCKVFREDEKGRWHNPEFTLLEWYRQGYDHFQLMDEIHQLISALYASRHKVDAPAMRRISYQQAFLDALGLDPLTASVAQLEACVVSQGLDVPVGMDPQDRDMWLDWLLTQGVVPAFAKDAFTCLYDYPASQAALARLSEQDPRVAHRFEVFYGELELANGFYELVDADQQAQRFRQENEKRRQQGYPPVPVDELLLDALAAGMPTCSGVAMGVDRMLMVLTGCNNIEDVLSFSFDRI